MSYISSKITFYTDAIGQSLSSSVQWVKGRITASPVFYGSKLISAGKEGERLNCLGTNPLYNLAIRTLSQEEQQQVRARGHAGWFKRFFWKPLTLKAKEGETTILVNINSAIKRLRLLGLSADEVKHALNEGNLISTAQEAYLADAISPILAPYQNKSSRAPIIEALSKTIAAGEISENELKELFASNPKNKWLRNADDFIELKEKYLFNKVVKKKGIQGSFFFDDIKEIRKSHKCSYESAISLFQLEREAKIAEYCTLLQCTKEQAYLVHDYVKAFKTTPQIAFSAITQMNHRLTSAEIKKVVDFVKLKKEDWEKTTLQANAPVRVRAKDFPGQLPRTIQYNTDGTIYILFNKVSKGDTLLGTGSFKTAKLALDLLNAEMVARVAQEATPEAQTELETAIKLSHQEGVSHTYGVTACTYISSKFKLQAGTYINKTKLGFMQKLYRGGDLEAAVYPADPKSNKHNYPAPTEKEKFLVAKRLLAGLEWLHHKKNMIHRDLKPANLFLVRDPKTGEINDCVIADFGFTCAMTNYYERNQSKGSPLYMSPELLTSGNPHSANAFPNDNWAAGVILYLLFKNDVPEWSTLGKEPSWFSSSHIFDLINRMRDLKNDWIPSPADPQSIGHIIRSLINRDPQKRMDTTEALAKVEALIAAKQLKIS